MSFLLHIAHHQLTGEILMLKKLWQKYWHILFALYIPIYLICFVLLESRPVDLGTNIHIALDDYIPFCKYFIIPYMLWFAYIAATVIFFFFYNRNEFIKYALFLITGMSICLVIYYIWPSYQTLRPTLTDSDIFTSIIGFISSADSSSNICPSIHVLNSLAAHIARSKSKFFKGKKILKAGSFVLMVLICLSTVFLKQHSVLDGIYAVILAFILYILIYSRISVFEFIKLYKKITKSCSKKNQ